MTYSYTQISQYLSCPRRYRHRYLDGWREKDTRAPMLFGRAFEQAVAALFRREDPAAVLFEQWGLCKDMGLTYSGNDTWDRMLQQGVQLLERFAQDNRVRIRRPRSRQQVQFNKALGAGRDFVAYVDAIGELDGAPCVLEWKTTSARYPEEPAGISALDPQLVCYSWMTEIDEVAQVVEFLARRFPESRRKAYYVMSIHEHLPPQARKDLKEVGWTKGLELATVARRDGQHFDCATWLHKARALPKEDFRREVEKELTGKEEEPSELIYFKVYKSQIPVIEQAIETAALMLGTDKSRGYCLEMICADFLAGAHLDNGNPEILLNSISRYYKLLSAKQQQAFLEGLHEKAS
jgi:hypothetical protein